MDILSQVGKKLITGTLKSKMKKYHDTLIKKMAEFILLENSFEDLIWFDKSSIEEIFNENKEILRNSDFEFNKLSEDA